MRPTFFIFQVSVLVRAIYPNLGVDPKQIANVWKHFFCFFRYIVMQKEQKITKIYLVDNIFKRLVHTLFKTAYWNENEEQEGY